MKAAVRTLLLLGAAGLGLAGCKGARVVDRETHERPITTVFPHSKHDGFDCVTCHTGIPKATRLGEAKLPTIVKCDECHDTKANDAYGRAARALKPRERRDYQITFNHADHLNRIKTKEANDACLTCHKDFPEPGPAKDVTPPMAACTACHHHAEEVAQAKCMPCHVSLRRYPLKPEGSLAAFTHTQNWVREHGRVAKNAVVTCAVCHDQTYCAQCHATSTEPFRPEILFPEKIENNFIHRQDYVSRHMIEVRADPAMCRRCHGSFFCDSCHKEQDLSPRVRLSTGRSPNNPHPPNWANNVGGGPRDFHGAAARANIVECAGCHDQGASAICTTCHRSNGPGIAGIGGNPHPPGYASKHPRSDIRKTAMCQACHTNG